MSDKIILLFLITFFAIPLTLFLVGEWHQTTIMDRNGDVSNWATLVIEVGIGVALGSTIFVYSNFHQKKSSEDITDVKRHLKQIRYDDGKYQTNN